MITVTVIIVLFIASISLLVANELYTSKATDISEVKQTDKYTEGPADPLEILELVNIERERLGVAPLVMIPELNQSAQMKIDDMVKFNYYDHENNDGTQGYEYIFKTTGDKCTYASENINLGQGNSQLSFNAWKKSKSHYEAMIDPKYTHTGIAVGDRPDTYSPQITAHLQVQHFCESK